MQCLSARKTFGGSCSRNRGQVQVSRARFARPQQQLSPFLARRGASRVVICKGLFGLGLPELAVIAGVAALIFGPSKLPELGKSLGKTVKSFQGAAKEFESELKQAASSDNPPANTSEAEKPKKPE